MDTAGNAPDRARRLPSGRARPVLPCALRTSPPPARPGQGQALHAARPGSPKGPSARLQGSPGGGHVVDHHHRRTGERRPSPSEGAGDVGAAAEPVLPDLRRGVAEPDQAPGRSRRPTAPAQVSGEDLGLVVPSPATSGGMEGNRHHPRPRGAVAPRLDQQLGQGGSQCPPALVLEAVDGTLQRPLVEGGGAEPGERPQVSVAATAGANELELVAAAFAPRPSRRFDVPPAAEAEPGAKRPAAAATRRQEPVQATSEKTGEVHPSSLRMVSSPAVKGSRAPPRRGPSAPPGGPAGRRRPRSGGDRPAAGPPPPPCPGAAPAPRARP